MSGASLEELAAMGLPTGDRKQRLLPCLGCGEFVMGERHCPLCGVDQLLAQLVKHGSPELLDALWKLAK